MRNFFALTFSVLVMAFASCENFLDIESPNDVDEENVFTSGDGLLSARNGMYNALQHAAYYGGYFPLMIDAYSDNGAAGGFDSPQLNQFNDKTLGADNIFVDNLWVAAYNSIYTANQIIAHVDGIDDPSLSDEVRADVKGEALTARALAHFDLLRTFGEHWDVNSIYGIPLVVTADDPLALRGRNTVQECYGAILSDLTMALDLVSNDDVEYETGAKSAAYITNYLVQALMARVYLYQNDYGNAINFATEVINSGAFALVDDPSAIYTTRLAGESIFELQFNVQDQSEYNSLTYVRGDALRVDVSFLANQDLDAFFQGRPEDVRNALVDFNPDLNDPSIQPDGRTQKYRGEDARDNPAYVFRLAEIYCIRAEAAAAQGDFAACSSDLQALADLRGGYTVPDVNAENFLQVVHDERRAELNFEGHRYCDLARIGQVQEVIGDEVLPVFPIPANQIAASGGAILQYPGY